MKTTAGTSHCSARYLLAGLLPILTVLGVACNRGPSDLHMTIEYSDVSGLQVGDDVRVSGVRVGEVERIDVQSDQKVLVVAVVDADARQHVTRDAKLKIKKESLISSQRYIDLDPGNGSPIPDETDEVFFKGGESAWDALKGWGEDARNWITSPETKARMEELRERSREAAEKGQEAWEKYQPELEAASKELLEAARREGGEAYEWMRSQLDSLEQHREALVD